MGFVEIRHKAEVRRASSMTDINTIKFWQTLLKDYPKWSVDYVNSRLGTANPHGGDYLLISYGEQVNIEIFYNDDLELYFVDLTDDHFNRRIDDRQPYNTDRSITTSVFELIGEFERYQRLKRMQKRMKIYAIDFDGTLSEHVYPDIGKEVPFAFDVCKRLQERGDKLILYTMRSGKELDEAVEWCRSQGLEFWGVNENPEQSSWTASPKVYAHRYIDDAAFGCPLICLDGYNRPMVDWKEVENKLLGENSDNNN